MQRRKTKNGLILNLKVYLLAFLPTMRTNKTKIQAHDKKALKLLFKAQLTQKGQ